MLWEGLSDRPFNPGQPARTQPLMYPVMCIKPNECDRPPRLIWALMPSCAHLCDVPYDRSRGQRSHGPLITIWHCITSCSQSKPDRVELSVRLLLGFFSCLREGRWGHKLQTKILLHSHQLQHCKTTVVKALKFWFHRGDWWNRAGTKVGLIQLHRSQYYPNTTYRLKKGCLWATHCLMDTHPALFCVAYWNGCRVKPWRRVRKVKGMRSGLIFLENTAKYWVKQIVKCHCKKILY